MCEQTFTLFFICQDAVLKVVGSAYVRNFNSNMYIHTETHVTRKYSVHMCVHVSGCVSVL